MYRYSRLYSYIHLFLGCSRIQDDQDGLQKKEESLLATIWRIHLGLPPLLLVNPMSCPPRLSVLVSNVLLSESSSSNESVRLSPRTAGMSSSMGRSLDLPHPSRQHRSMRVRERRGNRQRRQVRTAWGAAAGARAARADFGQQRWQRARDGGVAAASWYNSVVVRIGQQARKREKWVGSHRGTDGIIYDGFARPS
jgi:hypothetical protein